MWWKQLKEKDVTVPLISASAGDCVEMGYYGMKILWTVLDKKEKSFLLVTKYAIDSLPYNKKKVKTTWETSSLRKWLNSYFFSVVFSKDEAKMILETEVLADNNPEYSHPNFKNDPGNNTKDMLFVLSLSEVMNYFPKEKDRTCYPTPFANKRASNREKLEKGIWWLRTPGDYYGSSAVVGRDGRFNNRGFDVNYDLGVRPAMWVKI